MSASLSLFLGNCPTKTTIEQSNILQASTLKDSKYDGATLRSLEIFFLAAEMGTVWNAPMHLSSFSKSLLPDATVTVRILECGKDFSDYAQPVQTAFLLAGLVSSGEGRDGTSRVLSAKQRPPEQKVRMKATELNQTKVTIDLDGDDIVDENALLEDSLLAPPPAINQAATATDDCSGRKPCDNCTCGRADNKRKKETTSATAPPPSSSCGKCGLGDAFRCASCPYLGKPAFKSGEEHLVLDLTDDL